MNGWNQYAQHILAGLILSILVWVGFTTNNTSIAVAVISEKLNALDYRMKVQEDRGVNISSRLRDIEKVLPRTIPER